MGQNRKHLLHVRSSQLSDDYAKLPLPEQLEYGEIAINFKKGYETLTIKNDANEIVQIGIGHNVNKNGEIFNDYVTNTANGKYSHAEGRDTASNGMYSHAEGNGTISSGESSHAEGMATNANGTASHVEGFYTITNNNAEHAEGKYNVSNNGSTISAQTIHSVGIGTSSLSRKNAFEIMANGDIYVNGVGGYDGTNYSGATRLQDNIINANDLVGKKIFDGGEIFNNYTGNTATGNYSHAEGTATSASGTASHAEGFGSKSNGESSHAEGYLTSANGNYSHAEGQNTRANNESSHAEGNGSQANGNYSHAEGNLSSASGESSHAEGVSTSAKGIASHAEGKFTIVNNEAEHAEGIYNVSNTGTSASAQTIHSVGIGTSTSSRKNAFEIMSNGDIYVNGIGGYDGTNYSSATKLQDSLVGKKTNENGEIFNNYTGNTATGNYSHAEGNGTTANGTSSHAEGSETLTNGFYSHAEGYKTKAEGKYSHAEGSGSTATKDGSHAEGAMTNANGNASHVEGISTETNGTASHAEGRGTITNNNAEHAEGKYNVSNNGSTISAQTIHSVGIGTSTSSRKNAFEIMANGDIYVNGVGGYDGTNYSGATRLQDNIINANDLVGKKIFDGGEIFNNYTGNTATGNYSHAEGNGTTASGASSHAEGSGAKAYGLGSHAEGIMTKSNSSASHAEGSGTTASGASSHAEGFNSKAISNYSHAEGENTSASGQSSHAEGQGTQTYQKGEHAEGVYNKSYNSTSTSSRVIHSVGIGTSTSSRKNASEIKINGDYYLFGVGGFDGTNSSSSSTATLQEVINQNLGFNGVVASAAGVSQSNLSSSSLSLSSTEGGYGALLINCTGGSNYTIVLNILTSYLNELVTNIGSSNGSSKMQKLYLIGDGVSKISTKINSSLWSGKWGGIAYYQLYSTNTYLLYTNIPHSSTYSENADMGSAGIITIEAVRMDTNKFAIFVLYDRNKL